MRFSFSRGPRSAAFWLATAGLGALACACDPPARPPAATPVAPAVPSDAARPQPAAAPAAAYALDTVRLDRQVAAQLLAVRAAYPRLRPLPGTAPADTAGVRAFNQAAKALVTGLVQEIAATARDNRRQQLSSGLQVGFKSYALAPGLASVAFTITQDGIGPRPLTWATGLTYDLRTGRKLLPAALFRQTDAFRQVVLAALPPLASSSDDCELQPDNMSWDNFALSPTTYYLLLGDPQVGRACPVRQVAVPLARLRAFAVPGSPAARLR